MIGKRAKRSADKFEEKAIGVHGNKYDYSKVVYTRARDKVIIICPEHGEFEQSPNKHLLGRKCPKCASEDTARQLMKPFVDFVAQSDEIHNGKYSYDEASYNGTKTKLKITCPEHGEFMLDPDNHINKKRGCPQCTIKAPNNYDYTPTAEDCLVRKEIFLEKTEKIHGNKYDYSKVKYVNSTTDIVIVCPVHGDFSQTPGNHLAGKGCKHCSAGGGGFDSSKAGKLYYISIDNGKYYKIGITNRTVWKRFSKDEHDRIVIVKEWDYPLGRDAQVAETAILREHSGSITKDKVLRDGNTEIFIEDVLGLCDLGKEL